MPHYLGSITFYVYLFGGIALAAVGFSFITTILYEKRLSRRMAGFFGIVAVSLAIAANANANTGHRALAGIITAVIGAALWFFGPAFVHFHNPPTRRGR